MVPDESLHPTTSFIMGLVLSSGQSCRSRTKSLYLLI
eukprot:UN01914